LNKAFFKINESEIDMTKNTKLIFAVIGLLLVTCLLTVEFASALPMPNRMSNRPVQANWIRLKGPVNEWGGEDVTGLLQVTARSAALQSSETRELTSASAIWTKDTIRPIDAIKAKESFTYTFYSARLLRDTAPMVTNSENTYTIVGSWNVATVTCSVTITTNTDGDITNVQRKSETNVDPKVEGTLVVIGMSEFTLTLADKPALTGSVNRYVTRQMQFNPFKITDDTIGNVVSNTVTREDIKAVTKCYGAMPGWGSYDTRMDFNNNYRVDIADISTIAANM
jgi:hypothetical protein